ncbi:hypothetical protein [Chelatococcus asaccharovorans]|uniref:Uncharacterized protein n=1 Tax=Chelatococcus asaccharovorans TaxID=28210 RepID=A0A2V3UAP9_9HYPH|nr:hypothetical protein [Chelatococcus asaccharovorans]MBS7703170.1 hypothetical protein [Chelatococcus asaccharovorans]PXW61499.1 hypothetical protein C7450_10314 [Chelatococcus asaccharovorans]
MTVSTEIAYRELPWSGVETVFALGFPADKPADVHVRFRAPDGTVTQLAAGVNFTVMLASTSKLVTVTPIALPPATGILVFERRTPAIVSEVLLDGQQFPASVHQALHDRAAMRDAEMRSATDRVAERLDSVEPTLAELAAFMEVVLPEVTALHDETEGYAASVRIDADRAAVSEAVAIGAEEQSATHAAAAAASAALAVPAAAAADASELASKTHRDEAESFAIAAASHAAALAQPDYGFVTDVATDSRDYGSLL